MLPLSQYSRVADTGHSVVKSQLNHTHTFHLTPWIRWIPVPYFVLRKLESMDYNLVETARLNSQQPVNLTQCKHVTDGQTNRKPTAVGCRPRQSYGTLTRDKTTWLKRATALLSKKEQKLRTD